jgi:cytochrome c-type biogenesis protein CcmH/NrfF
VRILLALILVLGLTAAAEPKASLPDIEDEVMCVECRTALNVSTSPVADQERSFIREKIAQGLTKQEIKDELVAAYGPDVLATPEAKGFDLSAWLIPGALVAAFAAAVALLARRWRRAPAAEPAPDAPELDPEDARRLDADLAAFDR